MSAKAVAAMVLLAAASAAAQGVCCQAMPSCPAEYQLAKDGECSPFHRALGLCQSVSMCCRTIECIKKDLVPTPPPVCCLAMPTCGLGYKRVDFGECGKADFATKKCKTESLCCSTVHCRKVEEEICCQAIPECPKGWNEDPTCTEFDVMFGRCREERMCCKSIKCRASTH